MSKIIGGKGDATKPQE